VFEEESEGSRGRAKVPLDRLAVVMEQDVPFNAWLGLRHELIEEGFVRARVPYKRDLIGDATRPALHGGVLASIADAVSGAAVFSRLRVGDKCSTVDLRIDFLRPGKEQDVICEAEVLRLGRQVAVASARLYQESGEDIAVAKAVFMVRRAEP
jgi:uncharacterized protein (TIGR00369 family)